MTLIDEAEKIINSKAQTATDIKELSKIAFMMSKLYKQALNLAAEREMAYKLEISNSTEQATNEWKKITEADAIWKRKAEQLYWDYRKMQSDCKGMKEVMDRIDKFNVAWYVENKQEWAFISNNNLDE